MIRTNTMNRVRRFLPLGVLFVLAVAVSASVAHAQSVGRVYLTYGPEDRGIGGPIAIVPGTAQTLHVWLAGGGSISTPTPCTPGASGGEICGFNLELTHTGPFVFNDFLGDPAFDSIAAPFKLSLSPNRIAVNGLDLATQGVGNRHLGSLTVTSSGADANDFVIVEGAIVRSNLVMAPILEGPILLPEPSLGTILVTGTVYLAGLARIRRQKAARV